ncbi:hypothetical protein FBU31_007972, partial [Coemansia sp. 'formosensis']
GAHYALELLATETCFDVISLDWTIDPAAARERVDKAMAAQAVPRSVVLQGNLDPTILLGDEQTIRERTAEMCQSFGPARHIANLGHGMLPSHDPERLRVFLEAVHESSAQLRR